jgi:hypothetical protein
MTEKESREKGGEGGNHCSSLLRAKRENYKNDKLVMLSLVSSFNPPLLIMSPHLTGRGSRKPTTSRNIKNEKTKTLDI